MLLVPAMTLCAASFFDATYISKSLNWSSSEEAHAMWHFQSVMQEKIESSEMMNQWCGIYTQRNLNM